MAQCAFGTVTVSTAGSGCNPVVGSANPPITASFEAPACQLGIGVGMVLGTPSQQPLGRILVLGVGIAAQPMPALGPGCVLMPTLDVVLLQDVFASPYRIALPAAALPPTTIQAQGGLLYSVPGLSGLLVSISEARAGRRRSAAAEGNTMRYVRGASLASLHVPIPAGRSARRAACCPPGRTGLPVPRTHRT